MGGNTRRRSFASVDAGQPGPHNHHGSCPARPVLKLCSVSSTQGPAREPKNKKLMEEQEPFMTASYSDC